MKTLYCTAARAAGAAVVALLAAGCSQMDPFQRPGDWQPMGANAMNLELQVAHPSDLAQGRGTTYADGDTAAQAVQRLRDGKVTPLISWTTSDLNPGSSTSNNASGGSSSGGNP